MCTKLKKMVIKISNFGVDEQAKQGTHNYDGGVRKSKLLAIVKQSGGFCNAMLLYGIMYSSQNNYENINEYLQES